MQIAVSATSGWNSIVSVHFWRIALVISVAGHGACYLHFKALHEEHWRNLSLICDSFLRWVLLHLVAHISEKINTFSCWQSVSPTFRLHFSFFRSCSQISAVYCLCNIKRVNPSFSVFFSMHFLSTALHFENIEACVRHRTECSGCCNVKNFYLRQFEPNNKIPNTVLYCL